MSRSRYTIYALVVVLYLLHNDLWLWDDARLVAGLPVGLLYHVGFCFAASGLLYLLVSHAWPDHLDADGEQGA